MIKKGYILVFTNYVADDEVTAITIEAERIYHPSVKRKKKIAGSIDQKHVLIALPYKGVVLVITTLKSAKTIIFGSGNNVTGINFLRYDKDDNFNVGLPIGEKRILYNIDFFDDLYYETNRPETLLQETTKFYQVAAKADEEASLVYENKTNIPLVAKLIRHAPNAFAASVAQNLYSHNLSRLQTDFLFDTFTNRIKFMGLPFIGVARFPTITGAQPPAGVEVLSIDFDDWNTYERNDVAIQTVQLSNLGFITSIQYVLDMLADMNKPYEDKQYSLFSVDFTFVRTDPLPTEYIISIPEYGDVAFTHTDGIYTSVNSFPSDLSGVGSKQLLIHVSLFSDVFDLNTNIVTRSITKAILSLGFIVIVFNTDQYDYTIDFKITLVSIYDNTDTSFYDSVANARTRYINGNDAYAFIGIKLATVTNTPLNPGNLRVTDGAQTDVLGQYELSPSGIIPSTRFAFATARFTSVDGFGATRTRNETYAYTRVSSINADTLVKSTNFATDSVFAQVNNVAQFRAASFNYATPPPLNSLYSFTWPERIGSGDFGLLRLQTDGSLTWAVISILPSIFGEAVLLGEAQAYEGVTSGGLIGFRANHRLVTTAPIISSSVMQDLFGLENQIAIIFGTEDNELDADFPPASYKYYESDEISVEFDDRSVTGIPGGQEASTDHLQIFALDERKTVEIAHYVPSSILWGATTDKYDMHMIPNIVSDLRNVQSPTTNHLSRYYFIDIDFNLLGKLIFKWATSSEENILRNALQGFENGAKGIFNIYTKYRDTNANDLPLEAADIATLENQIINRTALELLLETHLLFNDFASFSLMLVCANSSGGDHVDNYIMIEQDEAA